MRKAIIMTLEDMKALECIDIKPGYGENQVVFGDLYEIIIKNNI